MGWIVIGILLGVWEYGSRSRSLQKMAFYTFARGEKKGDFLPDDLTYQDVHDGRD
jgi:hypothetical protein